MKYLPTADLYVGHLLAATQIAGAQLLSRHLLRLGRATIVMRYLTAGELTLASAERRAGQSLVYMIDDDLTALQGCCRQPEEYRARLRVYLKNLERFGDFDHVVCASSRLAKIEFPARQAAPHVIHPYWAMDRMDLEKKSRQTGSETISMAFLGTRSHLSDLELIREPLLDLRRRRPEVALHTFLGRSAPDWLPRGGVGGGRHHAALEWPTYRRRLWRRRFDVCLYPLADTPANRARSVNKFTEHAIVAAAALVSTPGPLDEVLGNIPSSLIPHSLEAWSGALREIVDDSDLRNRLAAAQERKARTFDRSAGREQATLWSELSGQSIPDPSAPRFLQR